MAESTLQAFVIRLSYVVDEVSAKKFQQGIKDSVNGLNSLRLSALAAVVGIEEAVRRTTGYFSSLDYLTRQVGVSAQSIERFRAELVGAGHDASEAGSILGSIADKFRMPGWRQAAGGIVGGPVRDSVDFLEKAAARYHDLMVQFHNDETAGPLVALRYQMEQLFGAGAQKYMTDTARNWELVRENAAAVDNIYKSMGVSAADAGKQSTQVELAFGRVGKELQVGFAKLLTTRDQLTNESLLDKIVKIADAFAKWMIKPETQKAFSDMLDRLFKMLPMIEDALTHIDRLVEILVGIWAAKKAFDFFEEIKKGVQTVLPLLATLWGFLKPFFGGIGAGTAITGIGFAAWDFIKGLFTGSAGVGPHGQQQAGKGGLPAAAGGVLNHLLRWILGLHAEGGVVPSMLHAGEMVLPANISAGLQSLFGTAGGSFFDVSRRLLDQFMAWFAGDSSYKPQVELGDETLRRMGLLPSASGANPNAPAGGAPDQGGGPGRGGGAPDQGGPGTQVKQGMHLTLAQMKALAIKAGFSEEMAGTMAAIAMAESGGDPYNRGSAGEEGLTQILPGTTGAHRFAGEARGNPLRAFQLAYQIYQSEGLRAWSVYKNGRYRQWLQQAQQVKPEEMPALTPDGTTGVGVGPDPKAPEVAQGVPGVPSSGGDVIHLNQSFADKLRQAFAAAKQATGEQLSVSSGFRNYAHQMRLWLQSDRSGKMVARPGSSSHEFGLAADLNRSQMRALMWLHQHAREFGLDFRMGYEDWHIEPLGARQAVRQMQQQHAARTADSSGRHEVTVNIHGRVQDTSVKTAYNTQNRDSATFKRGMRPTVV